jgi:hypothetical protein
LFYDDFRDGRVTPGLDLAWFIKRDGQVVIEAGSLLGLNIDGSPGISEINTWLRWQLIFDIQETI